jgi:hypothetical protein
MPAKNRLAAHIATVQARIDSITPEAAAKLEANLAVEPFEHFAYQEAQARAHVSGKLTADEAMIVYRALGEVGSESNGGWAADTDLATKVSVTLLMGELVSTSALMRAGRRA